MKALRALRLLCQPAAWLLFSLVALWPLATGADIPPKTSVPTRTAAPNTVRPVFLFALDPAQQMPYGCADHLSTLQPRELFQFSQNSVILAVQANRSDPDFLRHTPQTKLTRLDESPSALGYMASPRLRFAIHSQPLFYEFFTTSPASGLHPCFTRRTKPAMPLRKVIQRTPVLYRPHEANVPDYAVFYCVEKLECGHSIHTYPQSDPLIAVRRDCKDCGSNVIEFPKQSENSRLKRAA